jgi:AAHS family 4-hydroxybenzoate transporter-like MFS transporter
MSLRHILRTPVAAKTTLAAPERSRIGPPQIRVFALGLACLMMDGFDLQAMGYAAPFVSREWHVTSVQMASVFVAANFGVLLGSLLLSMVADRFGRRPVIAASTLFFAVMTLATARAGGLTALLWLRFVAGLGLGSILPNATALIGEFSPGNRRVTLMMCISAGFTAGGAIGGFVAAWLIPAFGWRAVFYFGGAIPLAVGVVMLAALPESPQYLALRRRRVDCLAKGSKPLDPDVHPDAATAGIDEISRDPRGGPGEGPRERSGGLLAARLFANGRALVTPLLWVVNFMNLFNLYALSNWLATVVAGMGYPQRTAVLVSTILQVGGTIGTFGLAWAIARFGFTATLMPTFAVAALSIGAIGHPGLSLAALFAIVFVAGWCIVGSQPGLNALAATVYPTSLRSTGVGWALGVGRLGAMAGPYVGGQLLASEWTTRQMFLAAAVPALVSAMVMAGLRLRLEPTAGMEGAAGAA